jgi:hypothetical protein
MPAYFVTATPLLERLKFMSLVMQHVRIGNQHLELPVGWMSPCSAYMVTMLSRVHRHWGIAGGVGEIGVYHGLFFIALAHTAAKNEPLFACDVFSDGPSGVDRNEFLRSVGLFGVNTSSVWVHEGRSSAMTANSLRASGAAPFRLLSIDGGHGARNTEADLRLADEVILPGGLVVLDDFVNDDWMGVREGFFRYVLLDADGNARDSAVRGGRGRAPRLVPFLLLANKLYLTTQESHGELLAVVLADPVLELLRTRVLPPAALRKSPEDEVSHGGLTSLGGWSTAVPDAYSARKLEAEVGGKLIPVLQRAMLVAIDVIMLDGVDDELELHERLGAARRGEA